MAATALSGQTVRHTHPHTSHHHTIQVEGVKVDVSLRTPWPLPEEGGRGDSGDQVPDFSPGATAAGTQRHHTAEVVQKRLSLLAVTPADAEEEGSEVNDELLEFSFTGGVTDMSADFAIFERKFRNIILLYFRPSNELMEELEQECDEENGMDPDIDDFGMECDQEEGVLSSSSSSEDESAVEQAGEGEGEREGDREDDSPPITVAVASPSPEPVPASTVCFSLFLSPSLSLSPLSLFSLPLSPLPLSSWLKRDPYLVPAHTHHLLHHLCLQHTLLARAPPPRGLLGDRRQLRSPSSSSSRQLPPSNHPPGLLPHRDHTHLLGHTHQQHRPTSGLHPLVQPDRQTDLLHLQNSFVFTFNITHPIIIINPWQLQLRKNTKVEL